MSVWKETIEEHRERLRVMHNRVMELWNKPSSEVTEDDRLRMQMGSVNSIEEARECLEWQAHVYHNTETRLKKARYGIQFEHAGISCDETGFYQDARLTLAVRFDDDTMQFVPMTDEEYIEEKRQSRVRHINQAAIENIESWQKLHIKGPLLYKRGNYEDLIQETQRKNAWSTTRRLVTRKEEWGKDKAELVNDPVFTASQIRDGGTKLIVRLYDGDRFVDAWEATHSPYDTDKNSFWFTPEGRPTDVLAFRNCPPDLYAEHLGRTYKKPDGTEEPSMYAWDELVPNVVCEFTADANDFLAALKRGLKAASTDPARPVISTVALELTPNLCKMISTDTYRLLVQDVDIVCGEPWQTIAERGDKVLLPREFCVFVTKAMKKPIGEVHVRIGKHTYGNDNFVYVVQLSGEIKEKKEVNPVQFVTRCVEGQFVNWQCVVPTQEVKCRITLDAEQTIAALKELAPIAKKDADRVICKTEGDGLTISAQDNDAKTEAHKKVEAEVSGGLEDFAFNHQLALDYISWQNEPIQMNLRDPLNVFEFFSGRSFYLLMPMQIM